MNSLAAIPSGLSLFVVLLGMVALGGRAVAAPPSATAPATVGQTANEAEFTGVTLTPKAEERLGIRTAKIERKKLSQVRLFGGEVMVSLGNSEASGSEGSQTIAPLLPGMSPADRIRLAESQVDADGAIAASKAQVQAAGIALERAERMLRDKSGSQRTVDEARGVVLVAQADLGKVTARRALLGPMVLPGTTPGRVRVRVPVYAGELQRIDPARPAWVGNLGGAKGDPGREARPIHAPPSADPVASSVDLFFELDNEDHRFRLGERVSVNLTLKAIEDSLVVPWSSVIIDIQGGTWVYENAAAHRFVRRRVQVRRVMGGVAVLASGPAVGASIVTEGAPELFGTEVGFSK